MGNRANCGKRSKKLGPGKREVSNLLREHSGERPAFGPIDIKEGGTAQIKKQYKAYCRGRGEREEFAQGSSEEKGTEQAREGIVASRPNE